MPTFRYSLFFLTTLILLEGCCNQPKCRKKKEDWFWYALNGEQQGSSFVFDSIRQPHQKDSLLRCFGFEYKGKKHHISVYTDRYRFACGGAVMYHLENLGIIHARGTMTRGHFRLYSSNKQIDHLLERIVAYIEQTPKDDLVVPLPTEQTIQFIEPQPK